MNGWPVRHHSFIVTMDDATSEIYSAFLVEEEGTASTFRAGFTAKGLPGLYTDRGSHYFHTPEAGGKVDKSNDPGRPRPPPAQHRTHRRLSPQARGRSERAFGTLQDRLVKELSFAVTGSRPQTASSKRATCPTTTGASQQSPSSKPAPSCHRLHPTRSTRSCACTQSAWSRTTTPCATKAGQIPASPARPHYVKATVRVDEYQRRTRPLPRTQMPRPLSGTASPSTHQSGRPREPLMPAPCGQAQPLRADHFPTGSTATTEADNRCATENRPNTLASDTRAGRLPLHPLQFRKRRSQRFSGASRPSASRPETPPPPPVSLLPGRRGNAGAAGLRSGRRYRPRAGAGLATASSQRGAKARTGTSGGNAGLNSALCHQVSSRRGSSGGSFVTSHGRS